jgi:hypothetical protein
MTESSQVTCLNINGNNTQNYQIIANTFNNLFRNKVYTTKKLTNKDVGVDKRSIDYLYTSFKKPFQKLILIKASAPFISSPLAYILNKSLSIGIFPTRLKYSEIISIYIYI